MNRVVFAFTLYLFSASFSGRAQPSSLNHQSGTPLGKLIKPDGTIVTQSGFNGSVDLRGWKMTYGEHGEPKFITSVPEDSLWDGRFARPGLGGGGNNGGVKAAVVVGTDLYVGGTFTSAGGVSANFIARWNGTQWSPLGSGMNNTVTALAVIGTNLYAGGIFTSAGGVSANSIARWDGVQWSALGSGLGSGFSIAFALTAIGTDLYVGGYFTTAGGVNANNIARWNGTQWSALGSGMDQSVIALATIGSDLFAGGDFSIAGGVGVNHIARWDGTQWSALGNGMGGGGTNPTSVYTLAVMETDLYAGGNFTSAGGVGANFIAKWNGSSWSTLGNGMDGFNPYVLGITVIGSNLFAGGRFTVAGGVSANLIAQWDGANWLPLASGMSAGGLSSTVYSSVTALVAMGTDLYAGGGFRIAGGVSADYVAKWNAVSWSPLNNSVTPLDGMSHGVSALALVGTDLYVGGGFTTAGGVRANAIARWDGTHWSRLGSGMSGEVFAIAAIGTDIYAGGIFDSAGGVSSFGLAKWNGTQWSSIGNGTNGTVYSLAVIGTDLYAGGIGGVAKWNGSQWSVLATFATVRAFTVIGSDLYAGGDFTTIGGVSANNIARWNGTQWFPLGSGVVGIVNALAAIGTDLYVGGNFTTAGGLSANRIARWNGSQWFAIGGGVNARVSSLCAVATDLYAGGDFTIAGGTVSANHIARWRGSQWSALGGGINGPAPSPSVDPLVNAIAIVAGSVYAGGNFTIAGGKSSLYIARWSILAPALPVHLLPADGSVGNLTTLTLRWRSAAGASLYRLQVATDTGFVALVVHDSTLADTSKLISALQPLTTYYWRVSAKNVGGSSGLTSRWSFRTLGVPTTAALLSPSNNATNQPTTINFRWQRAFDQTDMILHHSGEAGDSPESILGYWFETVTDTVTLVGLVRDTTLTDTTKTIGGLTTLTTYFWRVRARNQIGWGSFSSWWRLTTGATSIEEEKGTPREFSLQQNYPNPFNPSTVIEYGIKSRVRTTLRIFDLLGREVITLVDEERGPGRYQVMWNSTGIASGVYLYRLTAGEFVQTKKLMLMR